MLEVADSRFQDELARQAKDAGKLPKSHEIPAHARNNTPERIAQTLKPYRERGQLPEFPFGSDFTEVEHTLIPALQMLREVSASPLAVAKLLWREITAGGAPNVSPARSRAASTTAAAMPEIAVGKTTRVKAESLPAPSA